MEAIAVRPSATSVQTNRKVVQIAETPALIPISVGARKITHVGAVEKKPAKRKINEQQHSLENTRVLDRVLDRETTRIVPKNPIQKLDQHQQGDAAVVGTPDQMYGKFSQSQVRQYMKYQKEKRLAQTNNKLKLVKNQNKLRNDRLVELQNKQKSILIKNLNRNKAASHASLPMSPEVPEEKAQGAMSTPNLQGISPLVARDDQFEHQFEHNITTGTTPREVRSSKNLDKIKSKEAKNLLKQFYTDETSTENDPKSTNLLTQNSVTEKSLSEIAEIDDNKAENEKKFQSEFQKRLEDGISEKFSIEAERLQPVKKSQAYLGENLGKTQSRIMSYIDNLTGKLDKFNDVYKSTVEAQTSVVADVTTKEATALDDVRLNDLKDPILDNLSNKSE